MLTPRVTEPRAAEPRAQVEALLGYNGAVLVVSHDEHLITSVCDRLWVAGRPRCSGAQALHPWGPRVLLRTEVSPQSIPWAPG